MPAHQGKFVAYFQVSTNRQGKSGLGLEAQRKSVLDYLDGGRWDLVGEFHPIHSSNCVGYRAAVAAGPRRRGDRMMRREFITPSRRGAQDFRAADAAHPLATLRPFTPRALIAGLSTGASAEGGKSLP